MAKFEKVSRFANVDLNLPKRKIKYSAGYDFEVAEDIVVPSILTMQQRISAVTEPGWALPLDDMAIRTKSENAKPTLVPTGIKCQLDHNTFLQISVRSSCPLKYWLVLANGVGIIDADYYNNPDNEGEIFFQIINLSPVPIVLHKGDIIGQGVILSYNVTDDDFTENIRKLSQIITTHHVTVITHNFAHNTGRCVSAQLCQIYNSFCVSGSL